MLRKQPSKGATIAKTEQKHPSESEPGRSKNISEMKRHVATYSPPRKSQWAAGSGNVGRQKLDNGSDLAEAQGRTNKPNKSNLGIRDFNDAHANWQLHKPDGNVDGGEAGRSVQTGLEESYLDHPHATKTRKALLEKALQTKRRRHDAERAPYHDELRKEHDREELARHHEEPTHHHGKKRWCGNSIKDPRLIRNGGDLRIGKPSECFRRGVGGGIHQRIPPEKVRIVEDLDRPL